MKNLLLYILYIASFASSVWSEEGVTESLLLGSSDQIGKIERVDLCAMSREEALSFMGDHEKKNSIKWTRMSDKSAAQKLVMKTREASESSSGKIAEGNYIAVVVSLSDGLQAMYFITDTDAVMIIKKSGEQGASYPCIDSFSLYKDALKK